MWGGDHHGINIFAVQHLTEILVTLNLRTVFLQQSQSLLEFIAIGITYGHNADTGDFFEQLDEIPSFAPNTHNGDPNRVVGTTCLRIGYGRKGGTGPGGERGAPQELATCKNWLDFH